MPDDDLYKSLELTNKKTKQGKKMPIFEKESSLNNIFDLSGRVAIVTGALGLLGKNHCRALADAGAKIVVADLNETGAKKFASELTEDSIGLGVDISNPKSVDFLVESTIDTFGKIDILVNNAAIDDLLEKPEGGLQDSRFENYPLDLFRKVMDVNITGIFLTTQAVGREMLKRKSGSIINIASTYGVVGPDQSIYRKPDGTQTFFKSPAYSLAKGAVINFTRYLAAYWGNKGIRVNTISPGAVENNQDSYFIENYSTRTPLGRMAKQEDLKGAIVFLASDASSYMTGANLVVDGGWTAW